VLRFFLNALYKIYLLHIHAPQPACYGVSFSRHFEIYSIYLCIQIFNVFVAVNSASTSLKMLIAGIPPPPPTPLFFVFVFVTCKVNKDESD